MTIIPALDIINGNAVRLSEGDFDTRKIYFEDCLEAARMFEDAGLSRLHLVDLDGAKNKKVTNLKVLEDIASKTTLKIDFGGGVSTIEDVKSIFDAGAFQCTVGSLAVRSPETLSKWIGQFGADRFLIGADVLNEQIRISGWLEDGGIELFSFLQSMMALGLNEFFCTDISKDGMMAGPSIDLYKKVLERFSGIKLIASGGVTTMNDLHALREIGCTGAIIGKAIYEKTISLKELSDF